MIKKKYTSDHAFLRRKWPLIPRPVGVLVTFLLVPIGWVFFRAKSISQAIQLIHIMFSPNRASSLDLIGPTSDVYFFLIIGLVLSFVPLSTVRRLNNGPVWIFGARQISLVLLAVWSFGHVFAATFTPFLYFRF